MQSDMFMEAYASQDLSKRLKQLGYPQDKCYRYFVNNKPIGKIEFKKESLNPDAENVQASPSMDEIWEWLRTDKKHRVRITPIFKENGFKFYYSDIDIENEKGETNTKHIMDESQTERRTFLTMNDATVAGVMAALDMIDNEQTKQ